MSRTWISGRDGDSMQSQQMLQSGLGEARGGRGQHVNTNHGLGAAHTIGHGLYGPVRSCAMRTGRVH